MLLEVEYTIKVTTQVAYDGTMAMSLSDMNPDQKATLDRVLDHIGDEIISAAVKEAKVRSDEGFYSTDGVLESYWAKEVT